METTEKADNTAVSKFVSDRFQLEPGKNEIVIRKGDAEKFFYPRAVNLEGVIGSPAEFYGKRKQLHDPNKCHLIFDKEAMRITLVVDEQNGESGYSVTGTLEGNSDLDKFGINKGRKFTVKELRELLKFNRSAFVSKEENIEILVQLAKFKATSEKVFNDADDKRGNSLLSIESKLTTDFKTSFNLKLPIFKGQSPLTFQVEVCLEVNSSGVVVYLESVELAELRDTEAERIVGAELQSFTAIVCIEQ